MYKYKGFKSNSLAEMCTLLNIDMDDINAAKTTSDDPKDWFEYALSFTTTIDGKTVNITQFCKEQGWPRKPVMNAIQKGEAPADVFSRMEYLYNSIPNSDVVVPKKLYTYKNDSGSLSYLCKKYHYNLSTVSKKLALGLSLEEAFNAIDNNVQPEYEFHGFTGSKNSICKHFNLAMTSVNRRVAKGMTLMEALEEVYQQRLLKDGVFSVKGFTGTVSEICEHFNYDASAMDRFINGNLVNITPEILTELITGVLNWEELLNSDVEVCGFKGTLRQVFDDMELPPYVPMNIRSFYLRRNASLEDVCSYLAHAYENYRTLYFSTFEFMGFTGTAKDHCVQLKLNYQSVRETIVFGTDPKEAVEMEYVWQSVKKKKLTIGDFTGSVQKIIDHYGFNPVRVKRLLKSGQDIKTILNKLYYEGI